MRLSSISLTMASVQYHLADELELRSSISQQPDIPIPGNGQSRVISLGSDTDELERRMLGVVSSSSDMISPGVSPYIIAVAPSLDFDGLLS